MRMTAREYAEDFFAFVEFIDPSGAFVKSREDFDAMPIERREDLVQELIDMEGL